MLHTVPLPAQSRAVKEPPTEPNGQPTGPVEVSLNRLVHDPAFTPRVGLSKEHAHDLARALRAVGQLDPISVWPEPGTRRLIVVDGRHRAEAYQLCDRVSIPTIVLQGPRKEARLAAARQNARTTFPWSTHERTQYAWGLVIEGEASKTEIVNDTNVSRATVGTMRSRMKAMTAAGAIPSGNWGLDRHDNRPGTAPEEETDAVKQAQIEYLRDGLNGMEACFVQKFGRKPTMEVLGIANRWHLGQPRFKAMIGGGCCVDDDEFASDPGQHPLVPPPSDPNADF